MPLLEISKEIVMNTKTMIAALAIGATGFAGAAMAHEMDTDGLLADRNSVRFS